MKRVFGYNTKLLKRNLRAVIMFEIIFKITAATGISSLIMFLLNLSVKWSGLKYVTKGNIKSYLLSPSSIAALITIFIILILYTLFEITCIIIAYDASRKRQKITVIDIFVSGAKKMKLFFTPSGIPVILTSALLIPLSDLPIFSGVLKDLKISSITTGELIKGHFLYILFGVLILLLIVFSIFYMLVLHQIIICNDKFTLSFKTIKRLLKKRKHKALTLWLSIFSHQRIFCENNL